MIKYILFFTMFISSAYGNFQVSYLQDKVNYKDIVDVIDKDFTQIEAKKSFGMRKHVWLKATIKNEKNILLENYLSITNLQIMENVHFFTVVDGKVVKKDLTFNKYSNPNVPNRIGNSLLYQNDILPKGKIDVYLYITAKSHIYFELNSGQFNEVISKVSRHGTILIFLIGALVALSLYYGFLYIFTPNRGYLYYTFFTLSVAFFGFYVYGGYANYFDIFRAGPFSNTFIILIPIFTILFFKSIYKNHTKFHIYNNILNILLAVLILFFAIYILSILEFIPYFSISKYGQILYIIQLFIVTGIAVLIYLKRLPLSGLFLLGYSANVIGSLISIGFFAGITSYNIFTFHANIFGGVIEAILFSILLTYKLREVYKEKDDAISASKMQNIKIDIMNDTIDFISHQWRQPLSQINASVMVIDDIAYDNNIKLKNLEDELAHIENVTNYMSTTIDDFRNLFSKSKYIEIFDINISLENILNITEKTLKNSNIELDLDTKEKLYVKGNIGEISQTLLVIINNAKDMFKERDIENPKIVINTYSKNDMVYLSICDNAGGIAEDLNDKIFDAYFSKKDKTQGTGLGLYIAKMLIEIKLKGSLVFENKDDGACFIIGLKKENDAK